MLDQFRDHAQARADDPASQSARGAAPSLHVALLKELGTEEGRDRYAPPRKRDSALLRFARMMMPVD
jgi:hypothetical protein